LDLANVSWQKMPVNAQKQIRIELFLRLNRGIIGLTVD